ncbi:MAG: hypothetical protein ABSC05_36515 [Candidatus Solibacter sp.]|jgi:hypothetical protein
MERTLIDEKALLYRLACPLCSNGADMVQAPPILSCAESTARWLSTERFDGRTPSAGDTRAFFDHAWQQTAYFQSRDSIPRKEYEVGLREGIRACRRLRDILWRCEILQPISPYTLPIGDIVITGEYAVLRSSRRKRHALALYLRHQGVKLKRLIPDIVSFARQLDLTYRWEDPANRDWGIQSIGVMHYWVSRDLSAEHTTDFGFAADVLHGAAGVVTGRPFPIPGDHCRSCPTRACRPDDLVRPPHTETQQA